MKIIILAAGYAVRLRPLTLDTPKPLLPVGGKPMLERILEKIPPAHASDPIYIVTNAKFAGHFTRWAKASPYKTRSSVIDDGTTTNETRLGAIRDMQFVIDREALDDDILVIAGDNLFEFDLGRFLTFAAQRQDGVSIALYDLGSLELASNYGVVKVDSDSRVIRFDEKPANPESTLVSTGIYYFPKNKLPFIKKYVTMSSKLDAPGYYIGWLSGVDKVYGFSFSEDWFDIGSIESYRKADSLYTEKEK